MADETIVDKLKRIPEALRSGASSTGATARAPESGKPATASSGTLPSNVVIERRPTTTKDVNLPIKGSVLDRKASLSRDSRGPSMTRRGGMRRT
jgi:hypothetical protein